MQNHPDLLVVGPELIDEIERLKEEEQEK